MLHTPSWGPDAVPEAHKGTQALLALVEDLGRQAKGRCHSKEALRSRITVRLTVPMILRPNGAKLKSVFAAPGHPFRARNLLPYMS